MIASMTGFGSAAVEAAELRATVTARSVNHRYQEIVVSLPRGLADLEAPIREQVRARARRGKIEVSVQVARGTGPTGLVVNEALVEGLLEQARGLRDRHRLRGRLRLRDVLSLPGVVQAVEAPPSADGAREALLAAVGQALDEMAGLRAREGERLAAVLSEALRRVEAAAARLGERWRQGRPARAEALRAQLAELHAGLPGGEDRLLAEAYRLLDRQDVSEELNRLESHLAEARSLLGGGEPVGKRLDFLAQEMGREAATLASKAALPAMVRDIVDLRSAVEALREQVQNVE
jgi:uncharacterized protein (TIGR00255 family)